MIDEETIFRRVVVVVVSLAPKNADVESKKRFESDKQECYFLSVKHFSNIPSLFSMRILLKITKKEI
jgi:hypothetical protein